MTFRFESYRPGAIAEVVALHMDYYARQWNFGAPFETKVAGELAAFLAGVDRDRDLFVCARDDRGNLAGTITLDGAGAVPEGEGAHLRWFMVADTARGTGLGRTLLQQVMDHCRARQFASVYLTTFAGLDAARHLYESVGFTLVAERDDDQWHGGVREQKFVCDLADIGS